MGSLLARPFAFRCFNALVGGSSAQQFLAHTHLRASEGQSVLDIGCGLAETLAYLPSVRYTGFDLSPDYIEAARRRYGPRGTFFCQSVTEVAPETLGTFDLIIAKGVLHHLDDAEAIQLLSLAARVMKPGARLVTFDGCYVAGQSRGARWMLQSDRGKHVRNEPDTVALAQRVFPRVRSFIYHKLLRIPYTHIVLECER